MIRLLTDPEITILKMPRDEAYLSILESDLTQNGCVTPILTWKGIIIDGHKRHKICSRLYLPYSVTQKDFYSKNEAILYACEQEIAKEDIPAPFHRYLLGKIVHASVALSWERFMAANPQVQPDANGHYPTSCVNKSEILDEITSRHGLKKTTLYSYADFAVQIDELRKKDPGLVRNILTEKLVISLKNVTELSRLPADEVRNVSAMLEAENVTKINRNHVIYGKSWKKPAPSQAPPRKIEDRAAPTPKIKEMPAQDPDAELKSLTFTIPSWMGTIRRARERMNLPATSDDARKKLSDQLTALSALALQLQDQIQAGGNNQNG
jgi:hypothetical protein